MNDPINVLMAFALPLVIEIAILVHAKIFLSMAFNVDDRVKGPPLFRPRWRLAIYAAYMVGAVAHVEGLVPRAVGLFLTLFPILTLVILDLLALRRIWAEQGARAESTQR